jgi:thiamine pyrophosphokinase
VLANGELDNGPAVRAVQTLPAPRLIVVADGGLRHALTLNLVPNIIVGDMDSAPADSLRNAENQGARLVRHPTSKDETDLELALILAVQEGCEVIRIVGALGGRFDHAISNIMLLTLPELRQRDVKIVSNNQTMWLAYPGETTVQGSPGDLLSLVPLAGDVTGIFTVDLQYPLHRETLRFGPARGVSNVFLTNQAQVSFESGLLLIIHTPKGE